MGQIFGNGIFTSGSSTAHSPSPSFSLTHSFSTDGAHWALQRKATARIFTNASYRGIVTRSVHEMADKFLSVVAHFADKGEEIKLSKLFFSYSLDTFCEMAYSSNPGALEMEKEGKSPPFAAAFDLTQTITSRRFSNVSRSPSLPVAHKHILLDDRQIHSVGRKVPRSSRLTFFCPLFPLLHSLPSLHPTSQPLWPLTERLTGVHSQMKEATAIVYSYADDLIAAREKELAVKREKGDLDADNEDQGDSDLLTQFLKMREKEGLDDEFLRCAFFPVFFSSTTDSFSPLLQTPPSTF
jgi:hypothetical protein